MSTFTTPNGKEISTFIDPATAHIRIKFNTGGELPAELSGLFTSTWVAEKMINTYISEVTESPKRVIKAK